jgi:hypothetical protein
VDNVPVGTALENGALSERKLITFTVIDEDHAFVYICTAVTMKMA